MHLVREIQTNFNIRGTFPLWDYSLHLLYSKKSYKSCILNAKHTEYLVVNLFIFKNPKKDSCHSSSKLKWQTKTPHIKHCMFKKLSHLTNTLAKALTGEFYAKHAIKIVTSAVLLFTK